MPASDYLDLARAEPGRVVAYSVVPVLVALAQLANVLHHGISPVYPGLFALALIAFAALAAQYHVAANRVEEAWSATAGQSAD
ncbi:hypothetical protein ACFQDG_03205 [Natronoarchaeum mannanilyticum]|uniref:Uncharacterized protein n=1 Tax=Natronoarchaeum mannanilyticum TaxID=926360 RepID=A0AAV3T5G1_9EURY